VELMDIDRGTFSFVDLDNFALDHLAFSSAAFFAFSALSAAFYELFVELSSIFLPLLSFSFSLFLVSTIAFLLLFSCFSLIMSRHSLLVSTLAVMTTRVVDLLDCLETNGDLNFSSVLQWFDVLLVNYLAEMHLLRCYWLPIIQRM